MRVILILSEGDDGTVECDLVQPTRSCCQWKKKLENQNDTITSRYADVEIKERIRVYLMFIKKNF